jgi:ubiquinone/menaquinone biosynthesis C-methylase UbiE
VDLNPKFIDYARRKYGHAKAKTFEVGNATFLRFPEKHFDKAIVINALHHFPDDEATRLLSEIRRVTRRLAVIVDADGAPKGLLRRMLVGIDRGKFMRSLEGLSSVIGKIFEIDEVVRFEVGPYSEYLFRCSVDGELSSPSLAEPTGWS